MIAMISPESSPLSNFRGALILKTGLNMLLLLLSLPIQIHNNTVAPDFMAQTYLSRLPLCLALSLSLA
jgi:hypothetical protein